MWNIKCLVILIIIGAMGIVTKGLKNIWKQYQESIQQILYEERKKEKKEPY
jgi:TM2 domain-containing membrane protein YozV